MRRFALLLEQLAFTPQRLGKIAHLKAYFAEVPDPARGYALAALTRDLELRHVTPSMLRGLVAERVDEELFRLSYDFVGDLAETIALIWPDGGEAQELALTEATEELIEAKRADVPRIVAERLDTLGPSERYAYLKLATGGLRVGVSARLARLAVAEFGDLELSDVEEIWHGLEPPYIELFAWAEGGKKPESAALAPFRPVMLSTATDLEALGDLRPEDFMAEWKWDGIRVQAVSEGGERRLYSRTGEDISSAFPDLVGRLSFEGALDGELLIRRGDLVAPFGDLQKRLGRKTVSRKMQESHPAALRVYDVLTWNGRDLRADPMEARRALLESAIPALGEPQIDLSEKLDFKAWGALAALREAPPDTVIEGVMIKRRSSAYVPGRVKGHWFKWKRDPMLIDAVLLYAQRGHGKRSGYYSDFTFGVWDGEALVPVGKAYFGFTDEELKELDKFVRANTIERFGPVRSVKPERVVEVAFEGLNRSSRHKSGVAMRFPRISRIRLDKPASEADTLETLKEMLPEAGVE